VTDPTVPGAVPPIGIGQRFQPVPGAQLVRVEGGDGVARIPAAPGTPVHAVAAGMVLDVNASVAAGDVALRGQDGQGYDYAGLDPESVTVAPGAAVRAGDILGAVGPGGVQLRLTALDGTPADAVEALLGLPDSNELGYAASGSGLGIDPDELDREIVANGGSGR